jgi:hypothetical protein
MVCAFCRTGLGKFSISFSFQLLNEELELNMEIVFTEKMKEGEILLHFPRSVCDWEYPELILRRF